MVRQKRNSLTVLACLATLTFASNPPPALWAVQIEGATGEYEGVNGVYRYTKELIHGRPVYHQEADKDLWICLDSNGLWNVQPTRSKGTQSGFMISITHNASSPVDAGGWRVWKNGSWAVASGVIAIHAAEGADAMMVPTSTMSTSTQAPSSTTHPRTTTESAIVIHESAAIVIQDKISVDHQIKVVSGVVGVASQSKEEEEEVISTLIAVSLPGFTDVLVFLTKPPLIFVPAEEPRHQQQQQQPELLQQHSTPALAHRNVLAKAYKGRLVGEDGKPHNLEIVVFNETTALVRDAGHSHFVSVHRVGMNVSFTSSDSAAHFSLDGTLDPDESGNLSGEANVRSKKVATFHLKAQGHELRALAPSSARPVTAPVVAAPVAATPGKMSAHEGTAIASSLCVGPLVLAVVISCSFSSRSAALRAYSYRTLASASALLIGNMCVQCLSGAMMALPGDVFSESMRKYWLFLVFAMGWFLFSFAGWKAQRAPYVVPTLLWMLVADFVGLVGMYALSRLWADVERDWEITSASGRLLCALGILNLSMVVLALLHFLTESLRQSQLREEPRHPWGRTEVENHDWEGGCGGRRDKPTCGGPLRGCSIAALTGVGASACASACASPKHAGACCDGGGRELVVEEECEWSKDWRVDVAWAECTAAAVIEAFLVFKVVMTLGQIYPASWVAPLAFPVVIVALMFSSQAVGVVLRNIIVATAARLAALCALSFLSRGIEVSFQLKGTLLQLAASGATICVAAILVYSFSYLAERSGSFGICPLHWRPASLISSYISLERQDEEQRSKVSLQEVTSLGLMLAVACINTWNCLFDDLVHNVNFVASFQQLPVGGRTALCAVFAAICLYLWLQFLHMPAAVGVKAHLADIQMRCTKWSGSNLI